MGLTHYRGARRLARDHRAIKKGQQDMAMRASFLLKPSVDLNGYAGLMIWPVLPVIPIPFGIMMPTFHVIADGTMTRPPTL